MSRSRALLVACSSVAALSGPASAAVGTTCLCRSADQKTFVERTVRHHRWACDYLFGYLRGDPDRMRAERPTSETCNAEEVYQRKVYRCVSEGCTYPYARSTETPNEALQQIRPAPERRRP